MAQFFQAIFTGFNAIPAFDKVMFRTFSYAHFACFGAGIHHHSSV
ncbi:hypothetical protein [uncultured Algoriphagus sp.]